MPRVLSEVLQPHNVYVSRKSRSSSASSEPFDIGHDSQVDDSPQVFTTFDREMRNRRDGTSSLMLPTVEPYSPPIRLSIPVIESRAEIKTSLPNTALAIQKSKSKYNPNFLVSELKSDANYELSKSAMHYHSPAEAEMLFGNEGEYRVDDDDIRSSRGMHEGWPLYYYSPKEYDHMRVDAEKEKAKEKRYAIDATRIIPIYEDLSDDIPYSHAPLLTTTEFYFTSTDNPMSGHDPFFSVMSNDYFNKNYDYGDQLTLRGIDWNNGEMSDEEVSRFRRLPNDNAPTQHNIDSKRHNEFGTITKGDSEIKKGIANKHTFNKREKGEAEKANNRTKHHQNGANQIGFKDFVDSFANKFGSEDHNKDSKYIMKINQDKGENRKGFRRVYHKDEYQEDNEFYDNNNRSAMAEDKGSSNANIRGSEGFLKSASSAKLGNHGNAYDTSGNSETNKFENIHNGYDNRDNHNTQFHKYRDVAKQAAQSNNADYSLH